MNRASNDWALPELFPLLEPTPRRSLRLCSRVGVDAYGNVLYRRRDQPNGATVYADVHSHYCVWIRGLVCRIPVLWIWMNVGHDVDVGGASSCGHHRGDACLDRPFRGLSVDLPRRETSQNLPASWSVLPESPSLLWEMSRSSESRKHKMPGGVQ